jgi:F0F1-type ATP synthase assembly protein I
LIAVFHLSPDFSEPLSLEGNARFSWDYNFHMSNSPEKGKDPFVSIARYSEMGFILPCAVLLGYFLGRLADYWLHTKWLYLVGLIFGAVVGFWQLIRMALSASRNEK